MNPKAQFKFSLHNSVRFPEAGANLVSVIQEPRR